MKLVSSRYIGRLGNNMFQVAAAIGYANLYGYKWIAENKNIEVPKWNEFWPDLPKGSPVALNSYQCHDPKTFNFKKIEDMGTVRLMGFFQSEKYFKHCEGQVREAFKLPHTEGYQDWCSIHVRRGDYVKYKTHFPPVTMEYITKATIEMGSSKYMVFSDDIKWCKEHLIGDNFIFSEGRNEFEDMALMASCGSHIIANSSFSWWAAWLSGGPTIAPSHATWFGPSNGVTTAIGAPKDIIPDRWEQIDL